MCLFLLCSIREKVKDFISKEQNYTIPNSKLTFPPDKPLSYAFCSDTEYHPDMIKDIKNVNLLYHESTFLEDKKELTKRTQHSTAMEAASIARQANVGALILGHFSSRYDDLELFKEEAKTIFKNVSVAQSGKIFEIQN